MYLRELVRHDGSIICSSDHFLHEIQVCTRLSVIVFTEETVKKKSADLVKYSLQMLSSKHSMNLIEIS